jgi:hypothetical protein
MDDALSTLADALPDTYLSEVAALVEALSPHRQLDIIESEERLFDALQPALARSALVSAIAKTKALSPGTASLGSQLLRYSASRAPRGALL